MITGGSDIRGDRITSMENDRIFEGHPKLRFLGDPKLRNRLPYWRRFALDIKPLVYTLIILIVLELAFGLLGIWLAINQAPTWTSNTAESLSLTGLWIMMAYWGFALIPVSTNSNVMASLQNKWQSRQIFYWLMLLVALAGLAMIWLGNYDWFEKALHMPDYGIVVGFFGAIPPGLFSIVALILVLTLKRPGEAYLLPEEDHP